MSVVVRFAPSPTGLLHLGNARIALLNALFARRHGGRFVLRLDDTDIERSREEFAEAIVEDLAWLGIAPDEIVRQSGRIDRYRAAAERLKVAGYLYPAYETAEELERRRRRQLAQHRPPVYDRAALALSSGERVALEARGRQPHWRFLLPNYDSDPASPRPTPIEWDDLCRGRQRVDLAAQSDPVLIRADGSFLYTLPSIVDDIELGITHVIRGDDHLTNTGVQIALFEALGAALPAFAHVNLLTGPGGEALSKRSRSLSLAALRRSGAEPLAVAAVAVLTGTGAAIEPVTSLDELADRLDLSSIARSPAQVSGEEIMALTRRTLAQLPYEAVEGRLVASGIIDAKAFWEAVRGNIARFGEAETWWRIVTEPLPSQQIPEEDREVLAAAAALLPPEPWDEATFAGWAKAVSAATGRRGRALYHPLRLALTGRESGPELARLMPLIGHAGVKARLS